MLGSKYSDQSALVTALDKRENLMIIWDHLSYFPKTPYVVTSHLNRLFKTVQMRGHNICF